MFENAWREARNVKPTFWAYAPTTQTSLTSFVAITLQLYFHLASATFSKTGFSAKRANQTSECLSFALHSKILNNSHTVGEIMSTFHFFTSLAPSAHLLGRYCGRATNSLLLSFYTNRKLRRSVLSSKAIWIKHTSTLVNAETIMSSWGRSKRTKVEPFTSFCIGFVISFWSFSRQMAANISENSHPGIIQRWRLRLVNRILSASAFQCYWHLHTTLRNICRYVPFLSNTQTDCLNVWCINILKFKDSEVCSFMNL